VTYENARVDNFGMAYAGSQLQIQIYVNRRVKELSQKIIQGLPSLNSLSFRLDWVSPLEKEKFAEYQESAFLKAFGFENLTGALRSFWPRGGPVWDALASIEIRRDTNQRGILLVEAKSHPPEIYGGGMRAKARESKEKIGRALDRTKKWLGVSPDMDWTDPLYQSANRMAHHYFFHESAHIPSCLVNIYFLNDPHSPTDYAEWQRALMEVKKDFGIYATVVPYMADIFLEARDRSELINKSWGI
jgi:hypothetical protein